MADVQKSPANLLKEALKFGGFREETFECENANSERRLIPPFITSLTAGNLSLTIEFGDEVKSKSTAKRITYDVFIKNLYPDEYELTYEDSAEYADCAATEIPKAVMLKTKRESMIHHDRVYKRICKDIESKEKNEEKKKARLEQCKATYDERVEACNRNKFPTWEELDTVEDPEKVWYNRMMKASRAYNLDIDWDFEFDYADKEDKKVTCTVQVHQKKEGEEEATFLFKLDHNAELGNGKDEETGRFKTKGDFVRVIKGQLSEDIVNQLVAENIMEDVDSATAVLAQRHDEATEARLNETEEEREERIKKLKEEKKKTKKEAGADKKGAKKKTMRQKLNERKEAKKNAKETEKAKKKALEEKIAAKKEKLKAKAKAKRDAKKGKKQEPKEEDQKPKGKNNNRNAKKGTKNETPKKAGQGKTKEELRQFYLDTVKKVSKNDKLSDEKKKNLCEKYKKIYHEKLDALKASEPRKPARGNNRNNSRDERPKREASSRGGRDDRRGGRDDSRGAKRGRDDRDSRQPRGGKQMNYGQPVMYQPVMMPQQMYAPPPAQAYQPQQMQQSYGYQGQKSNNFSASSQIAALQAQQQQQMAALQAQLQQFQQPQPTGGRQPSRPAGRRGW